MSKRYSCVDCGQVCKTEDVAYGHECSPVNSVPKPPEPAHPPRVWDTSSGFAVALGGNPRARNGIEYLSLEEHEAILKLAVSEARAEGALGALKFANIYTDRAYAGLIAAEQEAKNELDRAQARLKPDAGV